MWNFVRRQYKKDKSYVATLFQFISIHFSSVTGDVRADSTAQRQKEKNPVEIHGRKKQKKSAQMHK